MLNMYSYLSNMINQIETVLPLIYRKSVSTEIINSMVNVNEINPHRIVNHLQ